MNVDALTEAVWQRLEGQKPRALLIGAPPENYHNYFYVNQEPFEAIVLGILPPGKLLYMPDEIVCKALLDSPVAAACAVYGRAAAHPLRCSGHWAGSAADHGGDSAEDEAK